MLISKNAKDLSKIPFFETKFDLEYKAFSNAISNADVTALQVLNLEENV